MVFTFQLLVSFTAGAARMYSVFAGVYFATQCQQRERESEREGKKQRGKVEAQCNYRLSWNGNEVDRDRGGKGVSAEQDITE